MIKLGICTEVKNIGIVQKCGYDYLETILAGLAAMSETDFNNAAKLADSARIRVEACNGMLPASVRVTGPDVSAQKIHDYLDLAFSRARRLGVEVVVFGSAGARNVPEGFDTGLAWRQICNFLRIAQGHAQDYGITIAIEPLRRGESNIINLVSEAVALSAILQLPNVKALGDTLPHGHVLRAPRRTDHGRPPVGPCAYRQRPGPGAAQSGRRRGLSRHLPGPEGRRIRRPRQLRGLLSGF